MLTRVRWVLVDRDPLLVAAWEEAFRGCGQVDIKQESLFVQEVDAIVSPANSFGFMDGGLDLAISQHFGWGVEDRVRERLFAEHDGELPVGQAIVVPTGHEQVPWLISAPTMRVPMPVSETVNAYLAFRAVIRAVRQHNQRHEMLIRSVACTGLGTGNGMMPPERCAQQMRYAYDVCVHGKVLQMGGLAEAVRNHMTLSGRDGR